MTTGRAMDSPVPPSAAVAAARAFYGNALVFYVALWIAEGALRKWVPPLNLIAYGMRDLLVALLVASLFVLRARLSRGAVVVLTCIAALAGFCFLQAILLRVPIGVVIYGLDAYISAPLTFVLAVSADLVRVRRGLLRTLAIGSFVNVAITVVQVSSPSDAVINREVDSDSAFFINPGDIVRASGTFSSPLGLTMFVGVTTAAMLLWLRHARGRGTVLPVVSLLSLLVITTLGGARGAVLTFGLAVVAFIISCVVAPSARSLMYATGMIAVFGITFVLVQAFLPQVTTSFGERFVNASNEENSSDRLLDYALSGVSSGPSVLGDGVGNNGNAAPAFGGGVVWLERDGDRTTTELGAVGYLLCVIRLAAGIVVITVSVRSARTRPLLVIAASGLVPSLIWLPIVQIPSTSGAASVAGFVWLIAIRTSDGITGARQSPVLERGRRLPAADPVGYSYGTSDRWTVAASDSRLIGGSPLGPTTSGIIPLPGHGTTWKKLNS